MGAPMLLLEIFASDILPVFLVASVGFALARYVDVSVSALSRVVLHALSPCLVFVLLVTSTIPAADAGRMVLFCVAMTAAVGLISWIITAPLRLDRPTRMGFLLVVMFSNGGNYGLPVTLFAFGRDALAFASIYFVTGAVLAYTVGVFLAASGRRSMRQALFGVLKVPTIYAVAAAMLVRGLGVTTPEGVMRPVQLLSDAAVPMMMLVLGMQLERATRPTRPVAIGLAVLVSLLVAPVLGFLIASASGFSGPARQAAVLQCSMPAAVATTILALEFDTEPDFVTSVVTASTLLSPLTLTWIIRALQQG